MCYLEVQPDYLGLGVCCCGGGCVAGEETKIKDQKLKTKVTDKKAKGKMHFRYVCFSFFDTLRMNEGKGLGMSRVKGEILRPDTIGAQNDRVEIAIGAQNDIWWGTRNDRVESPPMPDLPRRP